MEEIWYNKIGDLFNASNFFEVLPSESMTFEAKLNAIVRFFIYLGVILALLRADYRYLFMGIVAALISIVLYEYEKSKRRHAEKFLEVKNLDVIDNTVCARSTLDNPFMNPSLVDISENPNRPNACSTDNPRVQQQISNNFNARLFRDVSDVYDRMSSQREFYTVPSTTIPNDQGGFAEWCYSTGPTCKEGNGFQCLDKAYPESGYDELAQHRRFGNKTA
jgi:hypothetical protein